MMIAANKSPEDDDGESQKGDKKTTDLDAVSGKGFAASGESGMVQNSQPTLPEGHVMATAADVSLYSRALRSRWPIKPSQRRKIMNELMATALYGEDRELRMKASALVMSADKMNLEAEKGPQQHLHLHGEQTIRVVMDDDWYGSKAANASATDAAPAAGADGG